MKVAFQSVMSPLTLVGDYRRVDVNDDRVRSDGHVLGEADCCDHATGWTGEGCVNAVCPGDRNVGGGGEAETVKPAVGVGI